MERFNKLKWDTDGDMLSDKYERDTRSDPNNWDTDRDGLSDRIECFYGSDASNWDTDDDGLSDYMEYTGWAITFNYSGRTFNVPVRSNPLLNNTDGTSGESFRIIKIKNPAVLLTDATLLHSMLASSSSHQSGEVL